MSATTVERQRVMTLDVLDRVEELEDIASSVDEYSARRLNKLARQMVSDLEPIRISVAVSLLQLTKPTIQAWAKRGVLTPAEGDNTVLRLDPNRLHEVWHLVKELRAQGAKSGTLLDQVWYRLQDQALMDRPDLQESLKAWRSGDVIDA